MSVPAAVTVWTTASRCTGSRGATTLRYVNQCVSPGRREGLIQYVTADDRAVRAVLTGRFAAVHKKLVCKGVANPVLGLPTRPRPATRARATAVGTAA
jgi:hypothetical protein